MKGDSGRLGTLNLTDKHTKNPSGLPVQHAFLPLTSCHRKPLTAILQDVPKQSSSSSSKEKALLVLLGPGGASAWLDERLREGPEVWGGGGRIGMPEEGGGGGGCGAQHWG
jgi:hypothetical protein